MSLGPAPAKAAYAEPERGPRPREDDSLRCHADGGGSGRVGRRCGSCAMLGTGLRPPSPR